MNERKGQNMSLLFAFVPSPAFFLQFCVRRRQRGSLRFQQLRVERES